MRFTLLLPLFFVTYVGYAQWSGPDGNGSIYYNGGNVGIGETNPLNALHINGNMRLNSPLSLPANSYNSNSNNYSNKYDLKFSSGNNGFFVSVSNGVNDRKVYLQSGHRDTNYASATGSISLNPFGGNVGIGETNPLNALHVNGNVRLNSPLSLPANSDNNSSSNYANKYDLKLSSGNNGFFVSVSNGVNDRKVYLQSGHRDTNYASAVGSIFLNPFGGNVGVGTSNTDAKLTVNGDIHAEEVRVDLSVPGPDCVFEEDYNLPSLKSIQQYIQENKHLPEVPSAREMEENGIDLGVMNMLLLKKVEELTYI